MRCSSLLVLAVIQPAIALKMTSTLVSNRELDSNPMRWEVGSPVFLPSANGGFDSAAVKDPSVVFFEGNWHVFYTAYGKTQDLDKSNTLREFTTGYAKAPTLEELQHAPRFQLDKIHGTHHRYGCAPQVFFFKPHGKWYLVFQHRTATGGKYEFSFSTNDDIANPDTWTDPQILLPKVEKTKMIDAWVIADDSHAYLFYGHGEGRNSSAVYRKTMLQDFPKGWGDEALAFHGMHEANHVYKVKGNQEFHAIYETFEDGKPSTRRFGLASAQSLRGPWKIVNENYAGSDQLVMAQGKEQWTQVVSHGEALRAGVDEHMEYNPADGLLIQGTLGYSQSKSYQEIPWSLGVIKPNP